MCYQKITENHWCEKVNNAVEKEKWRKKDRYPNSMCMADHTRTVNCADSRYGGVAGVGGGGGGVHMQPDVGDYLNGAPSILLTSPISHLLNPADFTPARCSCSRHNFRFLRVLLPGLCSTCLSQAADHGPRTTDQRHYTCCESCRPACSAPACHRQRTTDHGPETLHLLRVLLPSLWSTCLSQTGDHGPGTLQLLEYL